MYYVGRIGFIRSRKLISSSLFKIHLKSNLNTLWKCNYSTAAVEIRHYQKKDFDAILTMIKKEPWNMSINELELAYTIDSQGGFVSTEVASGRVIGASVVYNIDDDTTVGVAYIVHSDYRGKGIGKPLFNLLLNHMSSRNMVSTAAPEMAPKYVAGGFGHVGDTLYRFEGNTSKFSPDIKDDSVQIIPYSPSLFDKVIKYESQICKPIRPELLKIWLNQPSSLTLISLINDTVCGYGVIYEATNTTRVAPLFADNTIIARKILHKLASEFSVAKERGFTIDLCERHISGIQMAKDMNLETVRIYPFMYKTVNTLLYHQKIYCRTYWQQTKNTVIK